MTHYLKAVQATYKSLIGAEHSKAIALAISSLK